MIRYIVCLIGLYLFGWMLMLGVGIAHHVWGVSTIGWQDAIGITLCLHVGFIASMLVIGSFRSMTDGE